MSWGENGQDLALTPRERRLAGILEKKMFYSR